MKVRARKIWSVNGKSHRITISLDGQICQKITELHDLMEAEIGNGWSKSKTINLLILGGILGHNRLQTSEWQVLHNLSEGRKIDLDYFKLEGYLENILLMHKERF